MRIFELYDISTGPSIYVLKDQVDIFVTNVMITPSVHILSLQSLYYYRKMVFCYESGSSCL